MWKYVVLIFLQSTEETAEENGLQILKRKNNRHKGVTCFIEQLGDAVICWKFRAWRWLIAAVLQTYLYSPRRVTLQTLPRERKSDWQSDCAGFSYHAARQSLLWPRLAVWCELGNSPRNTPALLGCWVQRCVSSKWVPLPAPPLCINAVKFKRESILPHLALSPSWRRGCSSARGSCGMGWQRSAVRSTAEQ